jgi:hypothetical protein
VKRLRIRFRFLSLAALLPAFTGAAYPQLLLTLSPSGSGTVALATGFTTKVYSGATISTNGVGPTRWTLPKGALPPGLVLNLNTPDQTSATITGTPTTAGTFVFVVSAFDPQFAQTATQSYSIAVIPNLAITTQTTLPNATLGALYSFTFSATAGTQPYTWFIPNDTAGPSPTAPPGLSLNNAGLLSGIPSQTGTFIFLVQVNDSDKINPQSDFRSFSLTVSPAPTIVTAGVLPGGTVGVPYQTTLAVRDGSPPFTWTLQTNFLPPGLTLSGGGVISGTPTQGGNFAFTVQARDVWGSSVTTAFTLAIIPKLLITTQSLPDGAIGTPYPANQRIAVAGGTPPYTFSVTGNFPAGLALNSTTGAITGTPTQGGLKAFTAKVTDSAEITATQNLTINIVSIVFTTTSLPDGIVGTPYSQAISVTGAAASVTFTVDSGVLPDGITLGATGTLSGTPTKVGTFQFVVRCTDSSQSTATQAYQLTVALPPLPPPTVTGIAATEPPAQQPTAAVQLANPYPLDLSVTITLTFTSAVGSVDDPAIQLSTGGRTAQVTIPAGATVSPNVTFSTGTVAGTITLTLSFQAAGQNVTPEPAPTSVIQLPAAAPVITSVTATRTSSGIEVDVTGFSNTRDMTSAAFTFQASAGTNLQTSQVTISTADQLFGTWFSDPTSTQYGSRFTFAQQFTISGNLTGITGVSATLANKQGTSNSMSANVQ